MVESVGAMVPPRSRNYRGRGRHLAGGADMVDGTCSLDGQPERTCSVEGCERKHEGLGYCRVHYRRVVKHGSPDLPVRKPKACAVDECDRPARSRKLCTKHYQRWCKHGDPLKAGPPTLSERLYARLVPGGPDGSCLEWTGAKLRGYGQIGDGGKVFYTHRVAWMLEHGPIPDGTHVCHKCDNPPCCNTEHLFLGDDAANVSDMTMKGRAPWQVGTSARGERNPNTKFTVDDVREVRRLHRLGYSQRQIAEQLGVPQRRVRSVVDGSCWGWVEDDHSAEATELGLLWPSGGGA